VTETEEKTNERQGKQLIAIVIPIEGLDQQKKQALVSSSKEQL
jgi:hypothetical protein